MKSLLNRMAFALWLAAALVVTADPSQVRAQSGLVFSAEAGLDDYCKVNRWLPVKFTLENSAASIDGEIFATVSDGQSSWTFTRAISIPSVSRKAYTLYTYAPNGRHSDIIVGLRNQDGLVHSETIRLNCVSPDDLLLGVWAQNPSLFNTQLEIDTGGSRSALLVLNESNLPDRLEGLQMLDCLTISGVDTSKLTSAQVTAIESWVAEGGNLIVTGGPSWLETAAAWQDGFLPLHATGTATITDFKSLQNLASTSDALEGPAVVATGSLSGEAVIVAGSTNSPLITERAYGFGKILYIAADPTLAPLRTWTGTGEMYKSILSTLDETPPWNHGLIEWASANDALNTIEGLGMPPFLLICGFILVYILIVGPLNFYFLRKRKKHDAAWLTIPALVIFFTTTILLVSSSILGNRPILNRLTIVQAWENADQAGVNGLIGIFSPQRETYSLQVENQLIAQPIPVVGISPDRWSHTIRQTDEGASIGDVRVDVGGMAGYGISGVLPSPDFSADFRIDIDAIGNLVLRGEFHNNSPLQLEDAVLLSGALPQKLGTIKPGDTVSIEAPFSGGSAGASGPNLANMPSPSGMDNTLTDLFGTSYMYPSNTISAETYRRFSLVNAAIGGPYNARGKGVYLFAWTDQSPYATDVSGPAAGTADTTLYIFHIEPDMVYTVKAGDRIALPPSMFTWSTFEPPIGSVTAAPYDGYLGSGEYSLRFVPGNKVSYAGIESLTLHLESYGVSGQTDLDLALWDFEEGAWSLLPQLNWGDTIIPSPDRFVSLGGEIRVKLVNPTPFGISVQQVDFTLTVTH